MQLDGAQHKQIRTALRNAFNEASLRRFLLEELDLHLDHLTSGNLTDRVDQLTEHFERQGTICQLLHKAAQHIPTNCLLQACCQAICPRTLSNTLAVNPFGGVGKIEHPDHYLLRPFLHQQVLTELGKGQNVCIIGAAQMGKSSYLHFLHQQGLDPINQGRNGAAYTDLILLPLDLIHSEEDFFAFLCDELGVDSTLRGFRFERKIRQRRILLFVDDVEKLMWDTFSRSLHSELRGLANGSDTPLTLVIASNRSLSELQPEQKFDSPLPNIHVEIRIEPFTLDEAHALVQQRMGNNAFLLTDHVEQTWHETQGHPARLQQAFKRLWRLLPR